MNPWIIVPAAGVGARMQSEKPKQYLSVLDRPILWWTFMRLAEVFPASRVMVPLAEADPWWPSVSHQLPGAVSTCIGGDSRAESVMQGLLAVRSLGAAVDDWVLIHDAVRPCVPTADLQALWQSVRETNTSALLGVPVVDSLRRVDANHQVTGIADRTALWRVFTPQIFPWQILHTAIRHAVEQGVAVTDESEAVLSLGAPVKSVLGSEQNIKLTYPADIARAEGILRAQREQEDEGKHNG